jgi:hypothetical protein
VDAFVVGSTMAQATQHGLDHATEIGRARGEKRSGYAAHSDQVLS